MAAAPRRAARDDSGTGDEVCERRFDPRKGGRDPMLSIAHRAGNSLASMHAANEVGVDVIECDVHEFRGRLEVRHLKTAGPLPFLWDRWEVASPARPRLGLAELLEADRHATTFMLDLKGWRPGLGRLVARHLHAAGLHRPILVCGRSWRPVLDVARSIPYVRPVLSARNRWELAALTSHLASDANRPYGVSAHRSLLDRAVVARLAEAVSVVMTWPVNDFEVLDEVTRMGVTGVISDSRAVLAELRRRRHVDS
jgi:glycerophosphoryl diester phosphodiesterase